MKALLTALILLVLVPSLSHAAEELAEFRAGAAAIDITPTEFPLNMPGGFSENMAQSAHDPLHARALVLDDGTTKLAMVVLDSLGAGSEVLDESKQIASKETGIPRLGTPSLTRESLPATLNRPGQQPPDSRQ